MQLKSAINQAVSDMMQTGRLFDPDSVTRIVDQDLYQIYKGAFSPKAIEVLEHRTDSLLHQYDVLPPQNRLLELLCRLKVKGIDENKLGWQRKIDKVHFFGTVCNRQDIDAALLKMIDTINHVCDLGYSKACLRPLGIIRLAPINPHEEDYVIFSYITLDQAGENYVSSYLSHMIFEEGGLPKKFKDQ